MKKQAEQAVKHQYKVIKDHHWRPYYHISPPAFWMNDPNGFCFFNGEYHLFYQHHPFSAEWGPMYWGHVKSRDLAHWEHLPIALAPDQYYDKDGCFSGSAIEKDGKLYVMYTGNVWTGTNHDEDLQQTQAIAVSKDGVTFEKLKENPVIAHTPEGDIHPNHFRDPKVWKYEESYYAVLGSKTMNNRGQVLLYKSPQLLQWEFVGIMAKGDEHFGYMWECPDFFHFNGKDVLVLSPQGMKPQGNDYHNLHQAGYLLGKLDYQTGEFTYGSFQLLDYGFDFYAPQTMQDDQGRRILIAWMDMWESEMPTQAHSWAGAMTIPREVKLKNNQLICTPVPELKTLRTDEVTYTDISVQAETALDSIDGDHIELDLTVDLAKASLFGLKLRINETENEETILQYDRNEQMFSMDRNKSGQGPGGIRKVDLPLDDNKLRLTIFIDKTSVEVFINGGEKVMTARIYPSKEATGISFFGEGHAKIIHLAKWTLNSAFSIEED